MRRRLNRMSQAEMIGITLVLILIMLGIIFVIKFVLLPEKVSIKKTYTQTEMAANFINTLLKTTTGCNNMRMTELIQDCAENFGSTMQDLCRQDTICTDPGGCRSCLYLNKSMNHILGASLDIMKTKYDIMICNWDNPRAECLNKNVGDIIYSSFKGNCKQGKEDVISKQIPVKTDVGLRVVQIYIC